MKHALIHNDKIVDVVDQPFPVHESMKWEECVDDVTTDWTYSNGNFQPPVVVQPTLEEVKEKKLLELKSFRKARQADNITLDGVVYPTTEENWTIYDVMETKAQRAKEFDLPFEIQFKSVNGFVTLDADDIIFVSNAVFNFVQELFTKEKYTRDAIENLSTITEVEQFDIQTYWNGL